MAPEIGELTNSTKPPRRRDDDCFSSVIVVELCSVWFFLLEVSLFLSVCGVSPRPFSLSVSADIFGVDCASVLYCSALCSLSLSAI